MVTDSFAWVATIPNFMVTAVRGVSAEEALRRWGRDYDDPQPYDLAELEQLNLQASSGGQTDPAWVYAEDRDGVVLVWEMATCEGLRPVVAEAVTGDGGAALAVRLAVGAGGEFTYAEDGQVLARASALAPGGVLHAPPEWLDRELDRAGVDLVKPTAASCLMLMTNLFGVDAVPPTGEEDLLGARVHLYPYR